MTLSEAKAYRWADMDQDSPMPKVKRRRVLGDMVMISEIYIEKGCEVPAHKHENEQQVVMLSGKLQFDAGGQRHVLEAGDVLVLPSNVHHGGVALEDSHLLDIFSPPTSSTGVDCPSSNDLRHLAA